MKNLNSGGTKSGKVRTSGYYTVGKDVNFFKRIRSDSKVVYEFKLFGYKISISKEK